MSKTGRWIRSEWQFLNTHQRAHALIFVVLIVLATMIEVLSPIYTEKSYALSAQAQSIIGQSRDDTNQYLQLSSDKTSYDFKAPDQVSSSNTAHYGRNDSVYATSLSRDAESGITYTDTNSKIDITVIPQFETAPGERVKGDNIVYPSGPDQLVYTHKYNGLKEDILVPRYRSDTLSYSFKLSLPDGVEAKVDQQGNIGIYSGDTKFFGNISYSTDKDKALLDKAREHAPKTNLVATIPSPVIKDAGSKEYTDRAHFTLSKGRVEQAPAVDKNLPAAVQQQMKAKSARITYNLSIVSNNLNRLAYPISIDPTITSSSASDWGSGVNQGNMIIDTTTGYIKRSGLTGGATATWTQHGTNSIYSGIHSATVYNGILYYGNSGNTIEMATLNASTGQPGAFTSAGSTHRPGTMIAYNGYMYYLGNSGTDSISSVYAPLSSTGTIGSFVSAGASSATGHQNASRTIYNGYVYIVGGDNGSGTYTGTVQYAPINTDGTIASFTTAAGSLNTSRSNMSLIGYNNMLYVMGGNGPGALSSTEYATIVNGVPGSWSTGVSMPVPRFRNGAAAWNGYLYIWGGDTGAANSDYSDTIFAPILADGSIGSWSTAGSFTGARRNSGNTMYNGVMYAIGGQVTNTPTQLNEIWYGKVNPVASTGVMSGTDPQTFTTARDSHVTVVGNGYLYVIGGCNVLFSSCDTNGEMLNTTYYAAINATTGALGSFSAGTSLPNARGHIVGAYYNGYIYVAGGSGNCGTLGAYKAACTDVYYTSVTGGALTNSWQTGSSLSTGTWDGTAAAYNGYFYVMMGRDTNSNDLATIQYAKLNPDGTFAGAFGTTNNAGVALEAPSATAYEGYMYVAFGYTGSSHNGNVYSSPINTSTGALTGFSTAATSPYSGEGGYIIAYNGYLYYMDGINSSNAYQTSVYYAPLTNGAVGSFTQSPNNTWSTRRRAGSGGIYNGRFYMAGGDNTGNVISNSVDVVPLYNGGGGQTGAWSASSSLATGVASAASVIANGFVYIFGGDSSGTPTVTSAVQRAPINTDGTMGTWTTLSSNAMTGVRYRMGAVVVGNYVYLLGGSTAVGVYLNTVEYALLNSDGSISTNTCGTSQTWCATTSLPNSNWNLMGATSYNGYIYLVGGNNGGTYTNTAYAAPTSTGTISSWTSGPSYPETAYWGPAVIAQNGYLYAVGGCVENTCATFSSSVYVSALSSSNGSMGSWVKAADVPSARRASSVNIYNGYLYVIGGDDNGTNINPQYIQYAALVGNGLLGTWYTGSFMGFTRQFAVSYAANGRICVIGGSTSRASTECAVLNSVSREATYSRIVDFDKGVLPTKIIVRGAPLSAGSMLGISYSSVSNTTGTTFSAPTSSSSWYTGTGNANATSLTLPAGISTTRYLYLTFTLDDSYSSTYPDSGGSTVTSYDMYFTPNPGLRLRGGQTFTTNKTNGSLNTN